MGVDERPPLEYTTRLRDYLDLVALDQGETDAAKELRRLTQADSPTDAVWDAADIEIRRRRAIREHAARK
jgi:hypothetical protein